MAFEWLWKTLRRAGSESVEGPGSFVIGRGILPVLNAGVGGGGAYGLFLLVMEARQALCIEVVHRSP